jgi:carbonic anhydrase/acetyltransferase-like protein (isoleucine patch superfamily)
MGSIVMDHAVIHSDTIIAAGAVVLEGTICDAGAVYAGVPAKKVKEISRDKLEGEINRIANNYLTYSKWFEVVNEAEKSNIESKGNVINQTDINENRY